MGDGSHCEWHPGCELQEKMKEQTSLIIAIANQEKIRRKKRYAPPYNKYFSSCPSFQALNLKVLFLLTCLLYFTILSSIFVLFKVCQIADILQTGCFLSKISVHVL